jgi:hypothetical protein
MAAGNAPVWAGAITFNPSGNGTGAGALSGVSGFTYATSSALAFGLAAPAPGATYDIYYESVVSGTTGNVAPVGAGFNLNNSGNQFTVIAGFQETITSINLVHGGGPGGTDAAVINFSLTTGAGAPNFFNMYANTPGSANPSTGTGAGFALGTQVLAGTISPASFNGSFSEAGTISGTTFTPATTTFNQSGLGTAITTTSSVEGGGGTQLSVGVSVNSFNSNYFPVNPGTLLFSTTNSLPFSASAPLSGFYSSPGASPNIVYGTDFTLGTTNGESTGGNSLMFQTVATNGFLTIPEPSSIVLGATAALLLTPLWLVKRRRRSVSNTTVA